MTVNRARLLSLATSIGLAAACSDYPPSASTSTAQRGTWGSNQASLTVGDSSATLQILASGGCFGSYGEISRSIPKGAFSLPGVYTQLIGAYPGKVQYAAQFTGDAEDNRLSITATVSAPQQSSGPFSLTFGVNNAWTACLYP